MSSFVVFAILTMLCALYFLYRFHKEKAFQAVVICAITSTFMILMSHLFSVREDIRKVSEQVKVIERKLK